MLDEEAKCRLDLLEELLDRGDDAEDDMDDLSDDPKDRLNCLYLSCAMGCHKDITYLLSDWDGWREIMADCLINPQQLTSFAAYAVSVRLFLGVLVKLNPPPTLKALMRLYLVTASPDLSWVDYENGFPLDPGTALREQLTWTGKTQPAGPPASGGHRGKTRF